MSRTIKSVKSISRLSYNSARPGGNFPSVFTKKVTHKAERRSNRRIIADELK